MLERVALCLVLGRPNTALAPVPGTQLAYTATGLATQQVAQRDVIRVKPGARINVRTPSLKSRIVSRNTVWVIAPTELGSRERANV